MAAIFLRRKDVTKRTGPLGAGERRSCRIRAQYQSWTFEPSESLFSHTAAYQPFRVALGLHHENHEITSVFLRDLLDAGST